VDKSTFGGIILAVAGILAGLILEGGKVVDPRKNVVIQE